MILSRTTRYGLRAVLYLATHDAWNGRCVSISAIAEDLNVPFHFLTKVLQQLTASDILTSYRGPGGGVSLVQNPSEITLFLIVTELEGPEMFESCVLGLSRCSADHPCPLHQQWSNTRNELRALFDSSSVAEMAQQIQDTNVWLADR